MSDTREVRFGDFLVWILLSIVTVGIYTVWWSYQAMEEHRRCLIRNRESHEQALRKGAVVALLATVLLFPGAAVGGVYLAEVWQHEGRGADVFDKPLGVTRVEVEATYDGDGTNFSVTCIAPNEREDLVINETLGTLFDTTDLVGTYRLTNCPVVEVEAGPAVKWLFRQRSDQ